MNAVTEEYTLTLGPSDVVLRSCCATWTKSKKTISFITKDNHILVSVTSISRPIHEEEPWRISGLLPNGHMIHVKYYAGERDEDGEIISGIASFSPPLVTCFNKP